MSGILCKLNSLMVFCLISSRQRSRTLSRMLFSHQFLDASSIYSKMGVSIVVEGRAYMSISKDDDRIGACSDQWKGVTGLMGVVNLIKKILLPVVEIC